MIQPLQSDDRLLADIEAARRDRERGHLWWLGQSGFLLQWGGRHLLMDPYLSDSLTQKYSATDKPHVRMTERVMDPSRLGFVDVVTSSHQHTDHLDAETLGPILQANPAVELVVPASNREFAAERLAISPDRLRVLDDGQSVSAAGFTLHAIPAAHETVERDQLGRCRFLGYVVEFGGLVIYHSGDTIRYDGMAERLRNWDIGVALLPINGRRPERRVAGNLWGHEAAELAHDCGIRLVIPCHYEMFEFNSETPDEFVTACHRLGQDYRLLRAGERFSFE
jgi:L-ascorbate metabolism protein UlaG (beta-lactamase superfamily)